MIASLQCRCDDDDEAQNGVYYRKQDDTNEINQPS